MSYDVNGASQRLIAMQREQARRARDMGDAAAANLRQARDAVDDIVHELERFEEAMDAAEEARIVVIGGPAGTTLFPEVIGSLGHDRVRFEGLDQDGCRVVVVQHVTQFNVMLKAVRVGQDQARRVGFHGLDGTG
ncbi:hypothetical protein [Sphingomonas sanguinis]|uniref:hypothetical protein n=1 Tax=Sphingomonas sanguinis TaxID=33051 RepID=UPI0007378127|nr:hypothetical protein [Sphingomonas sanguinis]